MPHKALSHAQRNLREYRPPFAQRGYGRGWRRLRLAVLGSHPGCTFCPRPASIVDHKKPLSDGGTNDWDNLRPVCRECHDILTTNYRRTGRNEMPTPEVTQSDKGSGESRKVVFCSRG